MKKSLLLIAVLSIILFGCKKTNSNDKSSPKMEVHYDFSTIGANSQVVYTSISENRTITADNIVTPEKVAGHAITYTVVDFVNPGDAIQLKMSTPEPVKIGYRIEISFVKHLDNGTIISGPIVGVSKTTTDNSGNTSVVVNKTFTSEDFK